MNEIKIKISQGVNQKVERIASIPVNRRSRSRSRVAEHHVTVIHHTSITPSYHFFSNFLLISGSFPKFLVSKWSLIHASDNIMPPTIILPDSVPSGPSSALRTLTTTSPSALLLMSGLKVSIYFMGKKRPCLMLAISLFSLRLCSTPEGTHFYYVAPWSTWFGDSFSTNWQIIQMEHDIESWPVASWIFWGLSHLLDFSSRP